MTSLSTGEMISLDWQELLERLAGFASSELAREELKKIQACSTAAEAHEAMLEIEEWQALLVKGARPQMTSLDLFAPWHQRLARNAVLKTLELKDVRLFCQEVLVLREVLSEVPGRKNLVRVGEELMAAEEPLSAIDQIMTAAGDIRNDASERLFQLNSEKAQLARQVQNILDRLVKSFNIEHLLQDRFVTTREGRWVLPIKSGMQHGFEGIIHDASQTKQTVFMEPKEAVPLNNRLREIELAIEEEIARLLQELSKYLASQRFQFEDSKNLLLLADRRLAEAQLSLMLEATACEFTSNEMTLRELRHPLLLLNVSAAAKTPDSRKLAMSQIVSNTIELEKGRRILLLSGPNAGGKTVLLKAIGLAAQMARSGLPICAAPGSKVPFFNTIVVALGDSQSVDANLSTFAAHLRALERAADAHGSDSLLLIDEICGSTDPEEGAALARSFLETYKENGSFGVVTSHLGDLKRGWESDSGVTNGSLEFNKNSGPTYRFIFGVPGQSLALQTAQRIGIDQKIVQRAKDYLRPEMRHYQDALSEIDQMKKDLLALQDHVKSERAAAEKAREHFEKSQADFAREKENLLNKELKKAERQVTELLQEAKAQEIFGRHDRLLKIKQDLPQIIKSEPADHRHKNRSAAIVDADEFSMKFPPGTSVYIKSMDRNGIVQGKPNNRDEVPVLSNSMRLMLNFRDLESVGGSTSSTQQLLRRSAHFAVSPAESDRILDVRGLTVDEAVSQLEMQLDAASLAGEDRVKIVHGHGTDALKRAVRSYLSRSVYVKKWQAGTKDTGGDGVTWVEL